MPLVPESIIETLREKDYKITPQRQQILEILKDNVNHPTAEQIFKQVREQLPNTSFTTIYNTLDLLKELGAVNELSVEAERRHFDPNTEPHYHLYCEQCGDLEDIEINLDALQNLFDDSSGFRVTGVELIFKGVYIDCQQ